MGLSITLQDEFGGVLETVLDPENFLHRALPPDDDPSCPLLSGIDFYGDTVFNRPQMKRFILEWASVEASAISPEERELAKTIRELAGRCANDVHLYLKFIGD